MHRICFVINLYVASKEALIETNKQIWTCGANRLARSAHNRIVGGSNPSGSNNVALFKGRGLKRLDTCRLLQGGVD